ncbi:MAG: hypothetical protein WC451_06570 [Patescibacteria group bacterium]
MKWGDILRKSWKYLKEHKTLWYLGILAALTEGGSVGNFGSNSSWKNNQSDFEQYGNQAVDWVTAHTMQIGIIALAIFIISLIIIYISYSARAGLIQTVNDLEESDKKPDFHRDFHAGQKYFWRMLGITVLIALIAMAIVLGIVIVAGGLIVLSISVSLWILILAVPVTLASIAGLFVLVVYLNVLTFLSYRVAIIENKKIVDSIAEARHLIHHNFGNLLLAWIINVAINTAFALAMVIAGTVVIGILTAIGFGIYYAGGSILTWSYAMVAFVAITLAMLILFGAFNAFFSTFWTIVYRRLAKSS